MHFYHILHKNSIGHLLRPHRIIFGPLPPKFRKEMDNIYVHFRRVFVEFVVLLLQFGLQIWIFSVTAKCWREGCSEDWFCPPPLSHQEVIDAI